MAGYARTATRVAGLHKLQTRVSSIPSNRVSTTESQPGSPTDFET